MSAVDVLRAAHDSTGRSPRDWLAAAIPPTADPVIAITRAPQAPGRLVHLGLAGRPTPSALVDPAALPIQHNAADGVRLAMCLHSVDALNGLFSELRRVLRPAATLAVLLPARPGWSVREVRAWRPLRQAPGHQAPPRHASVRDHPAWLLAAADFAVLTDQRRLFWLPLPDEAGAESALSGLTDAGILDADISDAAARQVRAALTHGASRDARLPIRFRLVVGRR